MAAHTGVPPAQVTPHAPQFVEVVSTAQLPLQSV
jgi:hypothetical protein